MEVYRFILKNCQVETGLVVNADHTNIGLLKISGKFTSITRSSISTVLVYNSVNNPIQQIKMTDKLQQMLLNIYVGDEDKPLFSGWAVRFVDDLVFFYDLEGKSYILDIHKILKIEPAADKTNQTIALDISTKTEFGFGRNYPECSIKSDKKTDQLQPMRIFSDQIKIEKWFLNYQNGFRRMERFKQRTNFYALPLLYDGYYRLGLPLHADEVAEQQEISSGFPLFFQWSDGKPYLYQHESWVGRNPTNLTPNAEPVFGFSSDIKAHLFHGSFIINLNSPVPGHVSTLRSGDTEYKSDVAKKETAVFPSFNYMALSGVDYGKSSYSAGFFYPIFNIQTGGKDGLFREVMASEGSPVFRYRYIEKDFRFRILYAYTRYDISDPSSKELSAYPSAWLNRSPEDIENPDKTVNDFTKSYVKDFSFTNHYYRIGFDWDINTEVSMGLDEIILQGHYNETVQDSTVEGSPAYANRVDYVQLITAFRVRRQFSDRVALSLYLNYYDRQQSSFFLNNYDTTDELKWSTYAIFEFIL